MITSFSDRDEGVKEGIFASFSENVQPPRRIIMTSCLRAASSGSLPSQASPAKKSFDQRRGSVLGPAFGSGASGALIMGAAPKPVGAMAGSVAKE